MVSTWFRKVTTFFLGLSFFFLPLQTAWLVSEPFVQGVKWQYGTLLLFATQLLLLVTTFLVFIEKKWSRTIGHGAQGNRYPFFKKHALLVSSSILFLLLNIYHAPFPWLSLQVIGFLGTAGLLVYCIRNSVRYGIDWRLICLSGLVLTAVVAIGQFLNQQVVGSTLFGIARHVASEAGASIISWGQGRALRAYGLFPHPNILGAYMVFSVVLSFFIFREIKKGWMYVYVLSCLLVCVAALFYSFSRTAIFAGLLIIVIATVQSFYAKEKKWFAPAVFAGIMVIGLAFTVPSLLATRLKAETPAELRSFNERRQGIEQSFEVIKRNAWFGTGLGNYTAVLRDIFPDESVDRYQPVHVVWLQILCEIGLIGTLLLVFWVFTVFKIKKIWSASEICIIFVFVLLGSFDHYLYTLYPGIIVSTLFFALF